MMERWKLVKMTKKKRQEYKNKNKNMADERMSGKRSK